MIQHKLLQQVIETVLIVLLLAGCAAPPTSTLESPTATSEHLELETETVPTPTQPAETGRYVVIDTDMGVDSIMAILYLLQAEGVDVKAITIAGGGLAHCQPGMHTALGLLFLTGNEHIPVACGRDKPLKADLVFPQDWREYSDGLAERLDLPAGGEPADMDAVGLLTSVIEAAPNKATLFADGPLTNLAEALQAKPDLADDIEMVYIMGGALEVPGNVEEQPSAEWNIYVDPYAANLVFASGLPVTLIPLDATNQVPATERSFRAFEQNHTTPAAEVIYRLMQNDPSLYQVQNDPSLYQAGLGLAAAILTDPSLGTIETVKVEVDESRGPYYGRIRVSEQGSEIQVVRSVDSERFLKRFLSVLNAGAEVEIPPLLEIAEEQTTSTVGSIGTTITVAGVEGMKTSGDSLWAWGENRILRYKDGEWSFYAFVPGSPGSFKPPLAYLSDTLWAVDNNRLKYFDGEEWQESPGGYWDIHFIEADDKTSILWGSTGKSLLRWNGEETRHVEHPPSSNNHVGWIAVTGDGSVWAGGLWVYSPDLGGLARYDDASGSWEMVRPWRADEDIPAWSLASTPNGDLWAMLVDWFEDSENLEEAGEPYFELALAFWDSASGEWTVFEEGLPEGFPLEMAAGDEGVWLAQGWGVVGGQKDFDGLAHFDGENWSHYLPGLDVDDVAVAPDGTIWYLANDDWKLRQLR